MMLSANINLLPIYFLVFFGLQLYPTCGSAQEQWAPVMKQKIDLPTLNGFVTGRSESVALSRSSALIGVPGDNCLIEPDGFSYGPCGVSYGYTRSRTSIDFGKKIMPNPLGSGEFGYDVSIYGDTGIIGQPGTVTPGYTHTPGYAHIYKRTAFDIWEKEATLTPDDGSQRDRFGASVSINGDTALIGAPGKACELGAKCGQAYIYKKLSGLWVKVQALNPSPRKAMSEFGINTFLTDNKLLVSTRDSVYMYGLKGGEWVEEQEISQPSLMTYFFGASTAIIGNNIFIGSSQYFCQDLGGYCGIVYVYEIKDNIAELKQELKDSSPNLGEGFGWSISGEGSKVIIGAPGKNCSYNGSLLEWCGAVFLYAESNGVWEFQTSFTEVNPMWAPWAPRADAAFGKGLSLNNDSALIIDKDPRCTDGWPHRCYAGYFYDFVPGHPLVVSKSGVEHVGYVISDPSGIDCGIMCQFNFPESSKVTLRAVVNNSSGTFDRWSIPECGASDTCIITMDAAKSVSAVFTASPANYTLNINRTGNGIITSNPAGINCGSICSASFSSGTNVTLTPSAGSGFIFANWTGDCSGSRPCTVTMDGAKTVGAIFTTGPVPSNYSLSVSKSGLGTITSVPARISCGSTCNGEFSDGTTVSLLAQPDYGFAFAGWSGPCAGTGTCIVTMSGSQSVSANFIELPKYPVKINRPSTGLISSEPAGILCGGPNRQCSSSFSSAKLTATPNPGYEFIRWNGCQALEGNICYIKPTGKMTVSAVFKKLPKYNLKITKNTLGSIRSSPGGLNCPDKKKSCSVKFIKGTQVTLTAVPQVGRTFGGWTGVCSGIEPCTFLVDGNKGVGATFQ